MKRAAIYCRVSTQGQAKDGHSLEWQIQNLPNLARASGATVTDEDLFIEVQSGANDNRPEYNRLMALIMEGYYQEVWVVETSRLSRTEDRGEVQKVITALKMFGCVIRTPGATFDVSTIEGEFIMDVDTAVNRMERSRIKTRLTTGRHAKIEKGGFFGHLAPTGYKQVRDMQTGKMRFQFDAEAIRPVKLVYEMALQGAGGTRILKELTKLGFMTSTGNRLSQSHIFQWLQNPAYAGFAHIGMARGSKAKEKLMTKADYIDRPLVSLEEWEQVQSLLDSRKQGRRVSGKFPLSGIILCPSCGEKMTGNYKGNKAQVRYYTCMPTGNELERLCPATQGRSIKQSIMHQLIVEALPEILEKAGECFAQSLAQYQYQQTQNSNKAQEADRLKQQIKAMEGRIMANIAEQELDQSEYRRQRIQQLEAAVKGLKSELAQLTKNQAAFAGMPDLFAFQEVAQFLTPDETGVIDDICKPLLTSLNYSRVGTHRKYTFRLISCVLKTGETLLFEGSYSFSQ